MAYHPLNTSWSEAISLVILIGFLSNVDAKPQRWIVSEGRPVKDSTPIPLSKSGIDEERSGMSALDEGLSENSIPDSVVVTWPSTEWFTDADASPDGTSTVTEVPAEVCKFGKTPAWQFVKCKTKAFMRKAKQIHGDTAKWIKDKSECLAKMSKGAGHAIEQTRQCLMKINIRSRDIDEQLKTCFTGGGSRVSRRLTAEQSTELDNREWSEGVVCFTGLSPKTAGVLQHVARIVILYIVQIGFKALMLYFTNGLSEVIFV
ncbi:uncharacterized protein LOC111272925 isoform X3 [Varroa jacobsoni]|nr:uncharacterized protein LOC111272925 isoform X3 [Varroa jacobsoni]